MTFSTMVHIFVTLPPMRNIVKSVLMRRIYDFPNDGTHICVVTSHAEWRSIYECANNHKT